MNAGAWTLIGSLATAAVALVTALFGFVHNRRSDTIGLYSSFVDDLHEEVVRLRGQYDADRKLWDARERELLSTVDRMRGRINSLEQEVQRLMLAAGS